MYSIVSKYKQHTINYNMLLKEGGFSKGVPLVSDLVVNIGIKEAKTLEEVASSFLLLELSTLQRPFISKYRKNVAHLKISVGDTSVISVTLRKELAYNYYFKLLNVFMLNNFDFSKMSSKVYINQQLISFFIPNLFKQDYALSKEYSLINLSSKDAHIFMYTSKCSTS